LMKWSCGNRESALFVAPRTACYDALQHSRK
jgi:hypothetical protein